MISLSDGVFRDSISKAPGPILVDFWAPWCKPCKDLLPILEEVEQVVPLLMVAKINIEENTVIATEYGVKSIPTLLLFNKGALVDSKTGFHDKQTILQWLGDAMGN